MEFLCGRCFGRQCVPSVYWRARVYRHQHFRDLFWTIPPSRKQWLLVGAYHDATLATDEERRELHSFFVKKGVNKRRLAEAISAVERPEQKTRIKKHPPASAKNLRFKCPVDRVEIFQPYRVLPKTLQGKNVGAYFTNPTLLTKQISMSSRIVAGTSGTPLKYVSDPLLEDVYPRATPASLQMIIPRHRKLCNKFLNWLNRTGRTVLGWEKDRVDVEFRDGRALCRAELKTCYGMTTTLAIREALGNSWNTTTMAGVLLRIGGSSYWILLLRKRM